MKLNVIGFLFIGAGVALLFFKYESFGNIILIIGFLFEWIFWKNIWKNND